MNRKTLWVVLSMLLAFAVCVNLAPAWAAQDPKPQEKKDARDEDEPKTESEKAMRAEMERKACGPKEVKHDADTDKKSHPTPDAPADKALVYVVRPTMMGNKIQTKLGVDGKWMGVNRGNNYFFFTLDPGEHFFCSQAENRSVFKLNLEPGKTYYLQQKVRMGWMKAGNRLEQIDEAEGKKALAKTHPSVFAEKK